MSEKSNVRQIDPMFNIPDEVGDFEYQQPVDLYGYEEGDEAAELGAEYSEDYFVEFDDEGDVDLLDRPDTPDELVIVSQTIRTTPSGMQVVDIVVEVEDVPGGYKYDFAVVAT
jgi:hypothetical protein